MGIVGIMQQAEKSDFWWVDWYFNLKLTEFCIHQTLIWKLKRNSELSEQNFLCLQFKKFCLVVSFVYCRRKWELLCMIKLTKDFSSLFPCFTNFTVLSIKCMHHSFHCFSQHFLWFYLCSSKSILCQWENIYFRP